MVTESCAWILACFLKDLTGHQLNLGQGWSWPPLHLVFSTPDVTRMPEFQGLPRSSWTSSDNAQYLQLGQQAGQGIYRPWRAQGEEGGPASARNVQYASC